MKKMKPRIPLRVSRLLIPFICVHLCACSPIPTATPFIPPTAPPQLIEPTLIIQPTKQVVIVQPSPIPTIPTPEATPIPGECTNNLLFVADITVPDNSTFSQGEIIDKQWLVENTGTCNWDSTYRLKHTNGNPLGAPEELALYPARAGTQAAIQVTFTAPFTTDFFISEWQAFDGNGVAFGDPIFIKINVQ